MTNERGAKTKSRVKYRVCASTYVGNSVVRLNNEGACMPKDFAHAMRAIFFTLPFPFQQSWIRPRKYKYANLRPGADLGGGGVGSSLSSNEPPFLQDSFHVLFLCHPHQCLSLINCSKRTPFHKLLDPPLKTLSKRYNSWY